MIDIEKFRMTPEMWQEIQDKRNEEARKFWAERGIDLYEDDRDVIDEEDV